MIHTAPPPPPPAPAPVQSAPPPPSAPAPASSPFDWLKQNVLTPIGNAASSAVDAVKQGVTSWAQHLKDDVAVAQATQSSTNPAERAVGVYAAVDLVTLGGLDATRKAAVGWAQANAEANANGTNVWGTDPSSGQPYFRPQNLVQNRDLFESTVSAGVQGTLLSAAAVDSAASALPNSYLAAARTGAMSDANDVVNSVRSAWRAPPASPPVTAAPAADVAAAPTNPAAVLTTKQVEQLGLDGSSAPVTPPVQPRSFPTTIDSHGAQLPNYVQVPEGVTVNFTSVPGSLARTPPNTPMGPFYPVDTAQAGDVVHDMQFFPGNWASATPKSDLPKTLGELFDSAKPGDVLKVDACHDVGVRPSPAISHSAGGVIHYESPTLDAVQNPLFNLLPYNKP